MHFYFFISFEDMTIICQPAITLFALSNVHFTIYFLFRCAMVSQSRSQHTENKLLALRAASMCLSLRGADFDWANAIYIVSGRSTRASARLKRFGPADTTSQSQTAQCTHYSIAHCAVYCFAVVSVGAKPFSPADPRVGLVDTV